MDKSTRTELVTENFNQWSIIEVYGHQIYAGHVTTEEIGGKSMIKLTVPKVEGKIDMPGFMKFLNHNSIFSITPVTKEYATEMAAKLKKQPIEGYQHEEVISEMAKKVFENMKFAEVKKMLRNIGDSDLNNEEVEDLEKMPF